MSARGPDGLAALVHAVAHGDERALAALHREMGARVHAFALRHVDDAAAAADVVAETFLEVWRHAARFGGASSASTWILGIARHKALDEVRRRSRFTALDEAVELPDESLAPAWAGVARGEEAERIRACVRALPPEQRECVHLAFYEELGLAEIARLQGVPENTVKTRLFHARRKLRLMLACLAPAARAA